MESQITIEGPGPLAEIGKPSIAIDWSKPVQTVRNRLGVKIYAIDHALRMPVIGHFEGDDGVSSWSYSGRFLRDGKPCGLDLENVPEVQS